MADYADLKASDQYDAKIAGSAVGVVIYNANDPSDIIIGAATSLTAQEGFEQVPVEEAGNDGTDEFVTGRHSGTGSMSAFWTPKWADQVPTRQQFIDREFVIIKTIAPNRRRNGVDLAGAVIEAFIGVKINSVNAQHGARGAMMLDLGFVYSRKFNAKEWAERTGT